MNIIISLIGKYMYNNWGIVIFLIVMTLVLSVIQTNVITNIVANIIDLLEHNKKIPALIQYKWFVLISILYLVTNGITKYVQTNLLANLTQWIRKELITLIIQKNTNEVAQVNIMNYVSPIFRVSSLIMIVVSDVIQNVFTNVAFILTIGLYFIYNNFYFGTMFLISNCFIALYIYYFWNYLMVLKNNYELTSSDTENHVLDIFTNFSKIIYRGTDNKEITEYDGFYSNCVNQSLKYFSYGNTHVQIITLLIYAIVCISIWHIIQLRISGKNSIQITITFITILLLYRDQITSIIQKIPTTYGEFVGRLNYITPLFDKMGLKDFMEEQNTQSLKYNTVDLSFNNLDFKNVTFKYKDSENPVLYNYTNTILLDNKIIGINGKSGKGKSTLMKLVLRVYKAEEGSILIDGINVNDINPTYIRSNITYIDQDAKLFNEKIIYNIMYGCSNEDECYSNLNKIMSNQLIKGLFSGINLIEQDSGALGANLSGGQRQVINIISGLINPSKILILDEPTNALDYKLKMEVIALIKEFSIYKKNIIIISHDKDVFQIYDKVVEIN